MAEIIYEKSVNDLVESLKAELPPMFGIGEAHRLTGGIIREKTLRNRLSDGTGPETMKFGEKVVIPRSEFIKWFTRDLKTRQTA